MSTISIISLIFSGVMMIIGVTTFIITNVRSGKKDVAEQIEEQSALKEGIFKANMKLDQLCATTTETRADIKGMTAILNEHGESIAVIKRDLETAFMRIDELRKQIEKMEGV